MSSARSLALSLVVLALTASPGIARAQPRACSAERVAQVLAPATESSSAVEIDCNLTLSAHDVVTRRLLLTGPRASGVTIECNGALLDGTGINRGQDMILVRSRRIEEADGTVRFERPSDITVRGCEVHGSVRLVGMGRNGEGADVRESSRRPGHVARARAPAPTRIVLDELVIEAHGRTPVYFAPGVTDSALLRSELRGTAASVALYLDAESSRNLIRDNYIHTSNPREQLAIDGSSHNRILANRFSALDSGGIYLYRNCGEGGTIRISTPSYNEILDNVFYYDRYRGSDPAVFLGSRDGHRSYCDADRGFGYGSSADDRDFAQYNVVMGNRIYRRDVDEMIITRYPATSSPNYLEHNETVDRAEPRLPGCHVPFGHLTRYIRHGESIDLFRGADGHPYCAGYSFECLDGELGAIGESDCALTTHTFGCEIEGSDTGCSGAWTCPSGRTLVAASAACNLESGGVSDAQLSSVVRGSISVVRTSDVVRDGSCWAGAQILSSGSLPLSSTLVGSRGVSFGCRERDRNGGDCEIRGIGYCY